MTCVEVLFPPNVDVETISDVADEASVLKIEEMIEPRSVDTRDVVVAAGAVAMHEHTDEMADGPLTHFETNGGRPVVTVLTVVV